ncbi:27676_t:CDS:2, partial [Gigaspora margarita]
SNKHFDNKPDECLNEESDNQSDDGFDKQVELYEGQIFKTIKETYTVVEAFAQSNRSGIRKGYVEKDANNGHEISRTFLCHHAGKLSNKKESYKIESKYYKIIPKNYKLTNEMLEDIKYYTIVGKLNASAKYWLPFGKYNALIHPVLDNVTTKSYSWLLEVLIKATDELYPNTILTDTDPTMHLHCIWNISQNLQKNFEDKLGSDWVSFIKDFYKAHNMLELQVFENGFKSLLISIQKQYHILIEPYISISN